MTVGGTPVGGTPGDKSVSRAGEPSEKRLGKLDKSRLFNLPAIVGKAVSRNDILSNLKKLEGMSLPIVLNQAREKAIQSGGISFPDPAVIGTMIKGAWKKTRGS